MHSSNIRRSCDECDSSSMCDEGSEDKRLCPKSKQGAYLLQKSPDSPLMVYERAALFLEQFEENRKRNHNTKKYDSNFIREQVGKSLWSPKSSEYSLPRSMSFTNPHLNQYTIKKKRRPMLEAPSCCVRQESTEDCNYFTAHDHDMCYATSPPINEDESVNQLIESARALNRKFTSDIKKDAPEVSIIVFFSMLWVMILGAISDHTHGILSYAKRKLAAYIIRFWRHRNMTSLLQKKECSKATLFLFSPVIALIGAFYSCVWIAYVVSKALRCPVPQRYAKRVNLKRLFEDD